VAWTLVVAMAGAYCAKAPPPPPKPPEAAPVTIAAPAEAKVKASLTLAAATDANPDASGRPSPVVVRIYQLRNDAAFNAAEFFALYDDEQKALGPELLTRDEFTLTPAERRTLDVTLSPETRFVGAIAAFRDIRNAQWRAIIPAPRTGMQVDVDRARVVVSVVK
jgi:type VI secretion system protein VasD